MKIIEVSLRNVDGLNLKKWYGINQIPQFDLTLGGETPKDIFDFWIEFRRLDYPKTGTIGFSMRVHHIVMQSDYYFQQQIEELMRD